MTEEKDRSKIELSVPAAIIIAGLIIALAIFATRTPMAGIYGGEQYADVGDGDGAPLKPVDIQLRPVGNDDHIRGGLDATVKVVVYSDTECPFCKKFHDTMKQVVSNYGPENSVAWVYRHFPLDSLHPKARKEAEALECANELGGGVKFWEYLDRLMVVTPSNDLLDPAQLPEIAKFVNLDSARFLTCLNSGRYADKVQQDLNDAVSAGGQGTPYSVVISANGRRFPVDGALPYESLRAIIEEALKDR